MKEKFWISQIGISIYDSFCTTKCIAKLDCQLLSWMKGFQKCQAKRGIRRAQLYTYWDLEALPMSWNIKIAPSANMRGTKIIKFKKRKIHTYDRFKNKQETNTREISLLLLVLIKN